MKTTSNRVRKKGDAKPATSQAKTPAEFRIPPDFVNHPLCLSLYDRQRQVPVEKIPLSETDLIVLRCDCGDENAKTAAFIAAAILEKMARSRPAPAGAVPKYVLSLIEWVGNKTSVQAEIDVTRSEFEALTKEDDCPNDLLKRGLGLMLEPKPIFELENAAQQSNALSLLLAEALDRSRNENGSNFLPGSTQAGGDFICGLQHLVWSTQARMTKAVNAK